MPEECCGAARGTTTITTSVLPTATGTIPRTPTTTSVFVVPDYFQKSSTRMQHVQGYAASVVDVSAGDPCPQKCGRIRNSPAPFTLDVIGTGHCVEVY